MKPEPIQVPSAATLKKYGLDAEGWLKILERQGWKCAICRLTPKTGRFNTDHYHRPGWKKLAAPKRAQYVRGILCHHCNRYYLGKGISIEKALQVAAYLRAFDARLATLL